VAVLTTIILVVVVIVTPVCLAMPIAIDPVAVLVSIRPMIGRSRRDDAARYAHESGEHTEYS
jgi:hypothetical protein